jgi:YD repeat-containing protein
MKKAVAFLCICAAVLWVTCSKSDNPAGSGDSGSNIETYTYTISGNSLAITFPASTSTYCLMDSLVTYTFPASTQTVPFELSNNGNTATIIMDSANMVLTRIGSGSGIQGQWSTDGGTISIDASTITVSPAASTTGYADDFIDYELPSELGQITATKISGTQVQLTGGTTNEVVTVTFSGSGDETYTSSNSAHAAGTWYMDPKSCPNETPDWYYLFLSANGASMFKKAMSKSVQQHHKLF